MTLRAKSDHDREPGPATLPGAGSGPPAHPLLGLQSAAGNRAVQRYVDTATAMREQYDAQVMREDEDEAWAARIAASLQQALDQDDGHDDVLALLSGRGHTMRRLIQRHFREIDGHELPDRLKEAFNRPEHEERLVKAWALLRHEHYHDLHVAVALAIIPRFTRDKELFRLLEASARAGSQRILRREYDQTYADLGQGSLEADLTADLAWDQRGMPLKKAFALLDHPLTDAERLYLLLHGLEEEGTTAIKLVESTWNKGPAAFHNLKEDWDYLVVGRNSWTDLHLWTALKQQLDDDDFPLANRIWNGYDAFRKGFTPEELAEFTRADGASDAAIGRLTYDQQDHILKVQIDAELRILDLVNPDTGKGADEERYLKALGKIQTLTQQRIALARRAGEEAIVAELERAWAAQHAKLLAGAGAALDPDSRAYKRARLLLEGNLNWADKLWLKYEEEDYPGIIALVTEAWAKGNNELQRLIDQCSIPRQAADGMIIRDPVILPLLVKGGLFGDNGERVRRLIESGDDVSRGRARLAWELSQGRGDKHLKGAYEFLTTPGLSEELRDLTIEAYVEHDLADHPTLRGVTGAAPLDKFLTFLARVFPEANTVWDFHDLLAPTEDIDEIVRRAEKRTEIATKGFSAGLAEMFDFGGEDAIATARESLERLQYIRDRGLTGGEIGLLLAMLGKTDVAELAGVEYELLRQRVEDALAAKAEATETFATIVEFASEVVLNLVAGGVPMIAGIGATLIGMGTRRAILGEEYQPIDQDLLLELLTPDLGPATEGLGQLLHEARFWHVAGRAAPVLRATAVDLLGTSAGILANRISGQEFPDADQLATMLVTKVGSKWAAQVANGIKGNIEQADGYLRRAKQIVSANMYLAAMQSTTGLVARIVRGDLDSKSLLDIAQIYVEDLASAQAKGVIKGLVEARESLLKQQKLDKAGIPHDEETPLDGRRTFVPEATGDEPTKVITTRAVSGPGDTVNVRVDVRFSESGEAEFRLDTRYGSMTVREALALARPESDAKPVFRDMWTSAARRLVALEDRGVGATDEEMSQGLEVVLFAIKFLNESVLDVR